MALATQDGEGSKWGKADQVFGRAILLADDIIEIRAYDHPILEFFEMMVVCQLLAMGIANLLGNDVDMPRNKSKQEVCIF